MSLKNKTVLITGASSGLGAEMARVAAADGANLILIARREDRLHALQTELNEQGANARYYVADVGKHTEVAKFSKSILDGGQVPDYIINNAGAGRFIYTEETEPEEAIAMTTVPYLAAFFVTRAFMPALLKRGSGVIVNITSPVSIFSWAGSTAYGVSRWAVRGFTELLHKDLYKTGLRAVLAQPPEISDSEYNQVNDSAFDRLPGIAKLVPPKSSRYCAQKIIKGMQTSRKNIIISPMLKLFVVTEAILPGVVHRLILWTGFNHKKLAHTK